MDFSKINLSGTDLSKKDILEKLCEYSEGEMYSFHMPGHKRNIEKIKDLSKRLLKDDLSERLPYDIDITEIHGFDDLHHPSGIIKESMERAAKVFKCDECYYLVNGSSSGILTAICAATDPGDTIIVGRNAHKSVYNAIYLRNLEAKYIFPEELDEMGIAGAMAADEVSNAVKKYPSAKAVMITSPTYEGVVSDIARLAKIVHEAGMLLIVDEAHGAHFGFHSAFPKSAIELGADIVINSLHKTLPSLTQTAILKVKDNGIKLNIKKIQRFLGIYQSSSPSYPLMASIERCVEIMDKGGAELFSDYVGYMNNFYTMTGAFKCLKVLNTRGSHSGLDLSKVVISAKAYNKSQNHDTIKGDFISGTQLMDILRNDYGIELEMAGTDYVLAMTTFMDSSLGIQKLGMALLNLDERILSGEFKKTENEKDEEEKPDETLTDAADEETNPQIERLKDRNGTIADEYVYVYPPGIPILVPGEVYTDEICDKIKKDIDSGLTVQGL